MKLSTPRIVFAGTPEFAAVQLKALLDAKVNIVAVYTQPDRKAGRGQKLTSSPVKQLAQAHELPVYQPLHFKDDKTLETLKQLKPDLMVVSAYGLILPTTVLNTPLYGCWNVHASLLPHYRGAAPIQYAMLAGDIETGVTLMQMDAGMDTGDMLIKKSCPIHATDTAQTLHDRLAALGAETLLSALSDIPATQQRAQPQPQDASYAAKILKKDARLDFSKSAVFLERQIRAFIPWPVAFFLLDQKPVRVFEAKILPREKHATPGEVLSLSPEGLVIACGEGALSVQRLQFSGKKPLPIAQALNGCPKGLCVGANL